MKPYTVLTVPNSKLRQKALPVECVDDEIKEIFQRMMLTMHAEEGVGLAATQVGITKRLVVMEIHDHEDGEECVDCHDTPLYFMANPEIIESSSETQTSSEGCLSVPGQYAAVTRPESVKIQYIDEYNKKQIIEADGLLAKCIQHEIDHLDGILFIDYLSNIKRKLVVQKVKKYVAQKKLEQNEDTPL